MGNNCEIRPGHFCGKHDSGCDFFESYRGLNCECTFFIEGQCESEGANEDADKEQNDSFNKKLDEVEKALSHIGDLEYSNSDINPYDLGEIDKELRRRFIND